MKKHFLIVLCFVFFNNVLQAQVLKTKDVPKDAIGAFKEKNPRRLLLSSTTSS